MRRSIVWIVLIGLVAYLVFVGGSWSGLYAGRIRLASVAIAASVIAVWAYAAWRDPTLRPRSLLLPAIGACLASLALSTAFSREPLISLEYLSYALTLGALYLLLVRLLAEPFFRARLLALATVLFLFISGGFLALSVMHGATWVSVLGRPAMPPLRPEFESLTFGSPSAVLAIVALLAVPVVANQDWATRRGATTAGAAVAVVGIVGLISGSRAGWLALAVAAGAAVAVWFVARRGDIGGAVARTLRTPRGRAALGATAVAVGALVAVLAPGILERITAGGEANRLTFVRVALRLFAEHPITGGGPGTWVIARPGLTQVDELDEYPAHAHNLYAQTLAELGVAGVAAGAVLIASLAWLLFTAARGPDPVRRRWALATGIGALYLTTHQLLDFWANMPAILFAAAIPVAYLDATSAGAPSINGRTIPVRAGGGVLLVVGFLLAAALAWLGAREIRAVRYDDVVVRANAGDWNAVDAAAREIALGDPEISPYRYAAGLTADRAGAHEEAAGYFRDVAVHDDLPEAWLNLAAEQAMVGTASDALASLEAAFRLGQQRPAMAMPIGDLALRLGDRELAGQAFAAAIRAAPSLAGDPWWSTDPARHAVFDEVVADLIESGDARAWEVALMRGDLTLALALATSSAGADAAAIVRAWGGDAPATGALLERCRAEPRNITMLLWCARLESRNGRAAEADAFRYLADAQVGESFLGGYELRVAVAPEQGHRRAGNLATAWGTYTYRRATPSDMLVPSLVHLGLN